MPGTWGGHSLWANGYNAKGIILDHTWGFVNNILSWGAAAAYLDEAHLVIDSVDAWRKKASPSDHLRSIKKQIDAVVAAVNEVSAIQIA
jgi:hypothetical protein